VEMDATDQLPIIYSAFVIYLRKKKMRLQWSSASAIYRLQESLFRREVWCIILIECCIP